MKDIDFKRKVEQAAKIQLGASFLKIPQAMRVAGFTDVDSKSAAKQMQVRRARDAMQKLNKHCHCSIPLLARCRFISFYVSTFSGRGIVCKTTTTMNFPTH